MESVERSGVGWQRVSLLACIKARVYHSWQVYHPEEAVSNHSSRELKFARIIGILKFRIKFWQLCIKMLSSMNKITVISNKNKKKEGGRGVKSVLILHKTSISPHFL